MSVYGARSLGTELGFFDALQQILVIPSEGVEPELVIEHEMAHHRLVQYSAIGTLERTLAALANASTARAELDSVVAFRRSLSAIARMTQELHESVAWFVTEVLGHEYDNVPAVPFDYRSGVRRLTTLVSSHFDLSWRRGAPMGALEVAEVLAIVALNHPFIGEVWARPPDRLGPDELAAGLSRGASPLKRFAVLCSWLAEQDAATWTAVTNGDRRSIEWPVPQTRLRDLGTEREPVIRSLCQGVDRSPPIGFDWDTWDMTESHFSGNHVDKFSRLCVLFPAQSVGPMQPGESVAFVKLDPGPSMLFSRYADKSATIIPAGQIGVSPMSWDGHGYAANYAVEDLARVLKSLPRVPAVVSSHRYDFGAGDTVPSTISRSPHVVMAMMDFVSLWRRLAWSQDRGLDGEKRLRAAILPFGSGPWGLLIIRGERNDRVLLVSPTLATQGTRILSAVEDLGSPLGVTLSKPEPGRLPDWVEGHEDRLRPLYRFLSLTLVPE
jgi:hypothetical protein